MSESSTGQGRETALGGTVVGVTLGLLLGAAAIFAALLSAGAGHGDYVAARVLFPAPMLLTVLEGQIGVFSGGIALLQFPLYGGLIGWSIVRKSYGPPVVVGLLHVVAALFCFAGLLPDFS